MQTINRHRRKKHVAWNCD